MAIVSIGWKILVDECPSSGNLDTNGECAKICNEQTDGTDPVKLTAASCGCDVTAFP